MAANSFMKIQYQNLRKKKEAVPEGRASDWNSLLAPGVVLADDEVRHATWQNRPHLPRHLVLDLADADAELKELLHALMETGPQIAVLVVAGVEKRPATTAGLLELVGELVQHGFDLGLVALETLGMKPDVPDDAFGLDVVAGVLAVSEETVGEDGVYPFGVENSLSAHSSTLLSRYCFIPSRHHAQISLKPIILRHKSQEAASAASWEYLKNFSFLLLQNMVRADVFNGFFCGFGLLERGDNFKFFFGGNLKI